MMCRDIIAVCSQIRTEHINTLCGQNVELCIKIQTYSVSVTKTSQYGEIIAVCSEILINHINTLCGLNVVFVNVIPGGIYSYHWALKFSNKTDTGCFRFTPEIQNDSDSTSLPHICISASQTASEGS
jgi:hypothetical protein